MVKLVSQEEHERLYREKEAKMLAKWLNAKDQTVIEGGSIPDDVIVEYVPRVTRRK